MRAMQIRRDRWLGNRKHRLCTAALNFGRFWTSKTRQPGDTADDPAVEDKFQLRRLKAIVARLSSLPKKARPMRIKTGFDAMPEPAEKIHGIRRSNSCKLSLPAARPILVNRHCAAPVQVFSTRRQSNDGRQNRRFRPLRAIRGQSRQRRVSGALPDRTGWDRSVSKRSWVNRRTSYRGHSNPRT